MPNRIRQMGATVSLAGALVVGFPVSAYAGTIYPPSDSCTASPATAPAGSEVEISCAAATFSSDERVTVTVSGANGGAARVGMVRLGVSTASGFAQSDADGSLKPVTITLPTNASGIYSVAAISESSAGGTAAVSIASTAGGELAGTGPNSGAVVGLWVGGGALVAAGATLATAAVVRRRQLAD